MNFGTSGKLTLDNSSQGLVFKGGNTAGNITYQLWNDATASITNNSGSSFFIGSTISCSTLIGTSSWAVNVVNASNQVSVSWASASISSSFSQTASYALNASAGSSTSASWASSSLSTSFVSFDQPITTVTGSNITCSFAAAYNFMILSNATALAVTFSNMPTAAQFYPIRIGWRSSPVILLAKMEKVLQILSASLAPITAISAIIIAWRQHSLDKAKFRHQLYEKRYAVFNSTMFLLSCVIREADVKWESLLKFIQETNQAYFLFGDGIANYLDDIYKKGVDLETSNSVIHGQRNLPGDERKKLIEKNKDLLLWFGDQMVVCRKKFGEHLMLR